MSTPAAFCLSCGGETDALLPVSVSSEVFGTLAIGVARREREYRKYIPAATDYQLFWILVALTNQGSGESSRTMIIIGLDFHPEFQQTAYVDTESGAFNERRLQHRDEAEEFYRELAARGVAVRVGTLSPQ